jgi:hypothetical protein
MSACMSAIRHSRASIGKKKYALYTAPNQEAATKKGHGKGPDKEATTHVFCAIAARWEDLELALCIFFASFVHAGVCLGLWAEGRRMGPMFICT